MTRTRNKRARATKNKQYGKAIRTRCRPRDMDQIQDDIKKKQADTIKYDGEENIPVEIDEDLPGYVRISDMYVSQLICKLIIWCAVDLDSFGV